MHRRAWSIIHDTSPLLDRTQGPIDLSIALSFGFTVFVIAFTIGHVSGGHLNCAVTLAFVVVKKISWKRGLMYFGAQVYATNAI